MAIGWGFSTYNTDAKQKDKKNVWNIYDKYKCQKKSVKVTFINSDIKYILIALLWNAPYCIVFFLVYDICDILQMVRI
jgi:hypothetical protein